jgi:hypothetical protein
MKELMMLTIGMVATAISFLPAVILPAIQADIGDFFAVTKSPNNTNTPEHLP